MNGSSVRVLREIPLWQYYPCGVGKHGKGSRIGNKKKGRRLRASTVIYNLERGWLMYVRPQSTNIYSSTCRGFGIHSSMRQPCFNKHSLNRMHSFTVIPAEAHLYAMHTFMQSLSWNAGAHTHTEKEQKKKYIYIFILAGPEAVKIAGKWLRCTEHLPPMVAVLILSHLKWIENWLLSMYSDAGLYIWLHVSNRETNTTQPTWFPDEKISMIVALREPRSHCQKLPTSIVSSQTGATLND